MESDFAASERVPRVLLVAPSGVVGGAEQVLIGLCRDARPAGYEPIVLCLANGPLVEQLRRLDVELHIIVAGRLREVRRYWRTMRTITELVSDRGIDVVYSNMTKAHLYAGPAARRAGVPSMWAQAMVPDPAGWLDRVATLVGARRILAASQAAARAQERIPGCSPTTVMYPGIDASRFRPPVQRRPDLAPVTIGMIGRLQPWKNQDMFLRAARLVLDNGVHARFEIVGGAILGTEGDYPARLRQLARDLDLDDHVTFVGHEVDVVPRLHAMDVAVNASTPEPFGLVLTEAMASECAVVAMNQGGPREIIEHGHTGLLVDEPDEHGLAAALIRLVGDPRLRAELGRNGRRRVEQHFSDRAMRETFAAAVREVTDERPLVRLIGIVPQGPSGVRDHATRLEDGLRRRGWAASNELLTLRSDPRPGPVRSAMRVGNRLLSRAMRAGPREAVIWQYSVFPHSLRGVPHQGALAGLISRVRGATVVTFLHEFQYPFGRSGLRGLVWSLSQRAVLPLIVLGSDQLIVSTEERAQALRRWARRTPVATIPVFSNFEVTMTHRPRRVLEEPRIAVPNWADEGTDRRLLAEVVASLPGVCFVMLGAPGDGTPQAVELRRRSGPSVVFTGVLDPEDFSAALVGADLVLLPNGEGPNGRKGTVAATLAHGVPSVGIDGPNTWRLLGRSGAVSLVDADAELIACRLVALLEDVGERSRMSRAAIRFSSEYLSVESCIDRLAPMLSAPFGSSRTKNS